MPKAPMATGLTATPKITAVFSKKPCCLLYHWTDSKIRVHLFVCVAALAYLTLLCQRLDGGRYQI